MISSPQSARVAAVRIRRDTGSSGVATPPEVRRGLGSHGSGAPHTGSMGDQSDAQNRTRLGTLSDIRNMKASTSTGVRTSHLATMGSTASTSLAAAAAAARATAAKRKNVENDAENAVSPSDSGIETVSNNSVGDSIAPIGGDSSAPIAADGAFCAASSSLDSHSGQSMSKRNIRDSLLADSVQTLPSANNIPVNYSGLSAIQVEVLRQISQEQSTSGPQSSGVRIPEGTCLSDLAILERKWCNLAMAQNIRAMKAMMTETPSIVNRAEFIFGYTAMHWAAKLGNGRMVEVLMRYHAEVSPVSSNGSTPLHIAAKLGHERICKLLVDAGANCDTRDYCGRQPKDLAASFMSPSIKDLLYTGLRKSLSVRYGRTLAGDAQEKVSHLMPRAPVVQPTLPQERPKKFRKRVDHLVLSLRFRRGRHLSKSTSSLSDSGGSGSAPSSPGQYSRHSFSGCPNDASPSSAPASPLAFRLGNARLGEGLNSSLGIQSPTSMRRHTRSNESRLPLSWVPAVRKRALEVEYNSDGISKPIDSGSPQYLATLDGPTAGRASMLLGSNDQRTTINDLSPPAAMFSVQEPPPPSSANTSLTHVPSTSVTSPDKVDSEA